MKPIIYSACLALAACVLAAGQASAQAPAVPQVIPAAPSDAAITSQIYSAFSSDQLLNGSLINVATKNGVVSLRGMTPTPQGKADAAGIASRTPGVRLVQDGLEVGKIPAPKPAAGEE